MSGRRPSRRSPTGRIRGSTSPGTAFRTREFPRVAGTLPPGIAALPDSDYTLGEDLRIGDVLLPSGRVVVGEYLFDAEPLGFAVTPGAYPGPRHPRTL